MNIGPELPEGVPTVINRSSFVHSLYEETNEKRELQRRLDVSRTTVDRAFLELENDGVATSTGSEYSLTLYGEMIYDEYRQFIERCNNIADAWTLLSYLPSESDFDRNVLQSATLQYVSRSAPQEPLDELERLIARSQRLEGQFPVLIPRTVESLYERTTADGVEADLIFESGPVANVTDEYAAELGEMAAADDVTIRCFEGELPFALVKGDEEAWMGVYDVDGGIKGAIVNDTEITMEWATKTFRQSWSGAAAFTLGEDAVPNAESR